MAHRFRPTLAALIACCALFGCSTAPLGNGVPDAAIPEVPLRHRPAAVTCGGDRPASNCSLPDAGTFGFPSCSLDSSCTAGTNGRCVGNPHDLCRCSYDSCTTDGDCGPGTLCDCRDLWHYGTSGPNVCLPSNCRVDADCGASGYCSPSLDPGCGTYAGITGWYCHTAKDECINDSDCAAYDGGYITPFCAYRPEVGRWTCSVSQCAG